MKKRARTQECGSIHDQVTQVDSGPRGKGKGKKRERCPKRSRILSGAETPSRYLFFSLTPCSIMTKVVGLLPSRYLVRSTESNYIFCRAVRCGLGVDSAERLASQTWLGRSG